VNLSESHTFHKNEDEDGWGNQTAEQPASAAQQNHTEERDEVQREPLTKESVQETHDAAAGDAPKQVSDHLEASSQ
jgi:hypothetical protein